MREIKGAPETFDAEKLACALTASRHGNIRWPFYDRRLHDVVEDAIGLDAPILLVEGNWLLLEDARWAALPRDFTIFVDAEESQLRDRLINRKIRGGMSEADAVRYYERSDGPNVSFCRTHSLPADLRLVMTGDGCFRKDF